MENRSTDGDIVVGAGEPDEDTNGSFGPLIAVPNSPGWAWLAAVVGVSLALWAVVVWLFLRVVSWLS